MKNGKPNFISNEPMELTNEDVLESMRQHGGYFDITVDDLREIYNDAYRIARSRLLTQVTAAQIMSEKPFVLHADDSIQTAIDILASHDISGAPVLDDNQRLCGIVSSKDIACLLSGKKVHISMEVVRRVLEQDRQEVEKKLNTPLKDIMTATVISVTPDSSLANMAETMRINHINRLPVVDGSGKLVGLVSRNDLVEAYSLLS